MELIQRLLHQRNADSAELENINDLKLLLPPTLKAIDQAVERLITALEQQQSVVIVGDFDVDGATSTALAVSLLSAMGLQHINYVIPDRMLHGYGLSEAVVDLTQAFHPHLIITVDNGISSHSGIDYANAMGIDVVVTDHHLSGDELPNALAIVNPNQPDCPFPSKNLAGVGVCFYVMIALRKALKNNAWFTQQNIKVPNLALWLDLVALGTVADLVALDANNRLLVNMGLKLMRSGRGNLGIKHLFACAKSIPITHIQTADLGFSIGPRLNAAGRLSNMALGIQCLLDKDDEIVQAIAWELNDINLQRRQLQQTSNTEAQQIANNIVQSSTHSKDSTELPYSFCLYDPTWHQGIVGLVASKLKDDYHRPTFVFADGGGEGLLKGSGRSIKDFHLRDALASIDSTNRQLIERFGGHAMAAGLTLKKAHFEEFKNQLEQQCKTLLTAEMLNQIIIDDGSLSSSELSLNSAHSLEQFVWGQGFRPPLFKNQFEVKDQLVMAGKHLRLSLSLATDSNSAEYRAVWFNPPESMLTTTLEMLDCYYRIEVNRFRGDESLQLIIESVSE